MHRTNFLIQVSLHDFLVYSLSWYQNFYSGKKHFCGIQQVELPPSKSHPKKSMSVFVVTVIKGYYLLGTLSFNVPHHKELCHIPLIFLKMKNLLINYQLFERKQLKFSLRNRIFLIWIFQEGNCHVSHLEFILFHLKL